MQEIIVVITKHSCVHMWGTTILDTPVHTCDLGCSWQALWFPRTRVQQRKQRGKIIRACL